MGRTPQDATAKRSSLVGLIGAEINPERLRCRRRCYEDAFAAAGMRGHYHLMDLDRLPGRSLDDLLDCRARRRLCRRQRHLSVQGSRAAAARRGVGGSAPDRRREHGHHSPAMADDGIQHRPDRLSPRLRGDARPRCGVAGKTALLVGAGGAAAPSPSPCSILASKPCWCTTRTWSTHARLAAALAVALRAGRARVELDAGGGAIEGGGVVNATPVGMLGIPGNPIPVDAVATASLGGRRHLHAARDRADQGCPRQGSQASWAAPACACTRRPRRSGCSPGLRPTFDRMHRTFAEAAAITRQNLAEAG